MNYLTKWIPILKSIKYQFDFENINKINLLCDSNECDLKEDDFEINNPIILKSAYSTFHRFYYSQSNLVFPCEISHPPYSNFEPFYTSWGKEFIGTVDYIWLFCFYLVYIDVIYFLPLFFFNLELH